MVTVGPVGAQGERSTGTVLHIDVGRVRVYSGGVLVTTSAEREEIASSCCACLEALVDHDRDWWQEGSYRNPVPGEPYARKAMFTSSRFCKACFKQWGLDSSTRTTNPWSSPVKKKATSRTIAVSTAGVLARLTEKFTGCKKAIIQHIIRARPPVLAKFDLVERVTGYRPEVVRRIVNELIPVDGLIDQYTGADGIDAPLVALSTKALAFLTFYDEIDKTRRAVYTLKLDQPPAATSIPGTLDAAVRNAGRRCARWVVECTIVGADSTPSKNKTAGRSPNNGRFDVQQGAGANPYFDEKVDRFQQGYGEDDSGEHGRIGDRDPPTLATNPLLLAIAGESFGSNSGEFATRLIGTSWPGWSRELEPAAQPESCAVCGYAPDHRREYRRLEACLGCLRAAAIAVRQT